MAAFEPQDLPITALVGDRVTSVDPTATLLEVAQRMAEEGISAVGVGDDSSLVGVLTERDVVRAVAARRDPAAVTASEMAESELIWTDPGASIAEVADEMMDRWIRHVLVGSPGQLLGIVSIRDVLGAYAAADGDDLTADRLD